jgi:hypothetical protein
MSRPTVGWLPRVSLAVLAIASAACSRPQLVVYEAKPLPLGKSFEVPAGRHAWPFRARPGERYLLEVEWPDGKLDIRAGSDQRDKEELDNDDAEDVTLAPIQFDGAHRYTASWVIGPKANTGFVEISLAGRGVSPIKVKISRD